MKILYKLTTRERPSQALRAVKSVVELSKTLNYCFVISLDTDDDSDYEPVVKYLSDYNIETYVYIKPSLGKIGSINRDINECTANWDILVNLSDDQEFILKWFDELIRDDMYKSFSGTDGVLHYPDGNRTDLMTLSIIGYDYYKRDNYIYNPIYITSHCDDEAQQVAIIRSKLEGVNRYAYTDNHIFNHNHPAYGKGVFDGLYATQLSQDLYNKDLETFTKRKSINFGLATNGN